MLAAYFLLGLGAIHAVRLMPVPHFVAKFSSILVVLLSALELASAVAPRIERLTARYKPSFATVPVAKAVGSGMMPPLVFLAGFLTGLCTLPCSGSIYLAVISLLAAETGYLEGLLYLAVYNLAYISPLVIILALYSNRRLLGRVSRIRRRAVRALASLATLALGSFLAFLSFGL